MEYNNIKLLLNNEKINKLNIENIKLNKQNFNKVILSLLLLKQKDINELSIIFTKKFNLYAFEICVSEYLLENINIKDINDFKFNNDELLLFCKIISDISDKKEDKIDLLCYNKIINLKNKNYLVLINLLRNIVKKKFYPDENDIKINNISKYMTSICNKVF